jgi:16S rRNA processing protein RimM
VLPSDELPSDVLPSDVLPSDVLPSDVLPSDVLPSDELNAGRVGRPHGLDGSFHVTRPRPALLVLGASVRIGDVKRPIERRAGTDDRPILRLDGVADRAGAEALRGEDLFVPRLAAPELEPGEYWAEDLQGCAVVTADGRSLGVVEGLRALPSCEVLEVGDLLVPMVGDAVRLVDVAARRIVVDAGFLGVGEPPATSDRPPG